MTSFAPADSLWAATAPQPPKTLPLEASAKADVAIIGAGFTGLSAALHLAQQGVSVVVLEAMEIGHGGSGRNKGLVNAGMWVLPDDLPATLGAPHGERLLNLLADAPSLVYELVEHHRMDCEAVRNGTLHLAADANGLKQLQTRAAQWQARNAPVELLDAGETARLTGTGAYHGALLDRRAGTIQPLAYARELARAAMGAGATIHTQSPAAKVVRAGSDWCVQTPKGQITASTIIVATNAYTVNLWPQLRSELVFLPYFNFATEPLPASLGNTILPEGHGAWDTKKVLTSFRKDQTGRFIFGSVGMLEGMDARVHALWARRRMEKLFPQLKGIGFQKSWYGMIGMTDDHLPRFHQLDENIFGFSGYNGRGIAPGTVFGRVLADFATDRISAAELPLPVTEPRPQKLRNIQEAGIRHGASALHLMRSFI